MLVALRNRIKYSRKKMREDPSKVPPPKKMREATIKNDLLRRYPTRINDGTSSEDAASMHCRAPQRCDLRDGQGEAS